MRWFNPSKPEEELYDCDADPHEVNNLSGDPQYADILEDLRQVHKAWMEEINDLGQLTEKELVWKMWPGGVQPETADPVVSENEHVLVLRSQTKGASIGYKINPEDAESRSNWTLYTKPFQISCDDSIYVIAHRIGYKPSEIIMHLCN